MTAPLVLRQEDVDHGAVGDGGAVTDGLYPGDVPHSLQERACLGTQAQLRLLHDLGVPPQCHPEGAQEVPWEAHTDPSLAPDHPDKRGKTCRGSLAGNTKTKDAGGTEERMDIGGHVEACQHESLCAPISCARPGIHLVTQPHDKCEPEGGPAAEER